MTNVALNIAGHTMRDVVTLFEGDIPDHLKSMMENVCAYPCTVRVARPCFDGFTEFCAQAIRDKKPVGHYATNRISSFDVSMYARKQAGITRDKYGTETGHGEIEYIEIAFPNHHELVYFIGERLKMPARIDRLLKYYDNHFDDHHLGKRENTIIQAKKALDGIGREYERRREYEQRQERYLTEQEKRPVYVSPDEVRAQWRKDIEADVW